MPDVIEMSARGLDLSPRFVESTTVVASPADATETIVASVTIPSGLTVISGVEVYGWAAFTVGTNGVSVNAKIHQTGTSGTTVVASGAVTATAANLGFASLAGFDTAPASGQVYKLTLTVASATVGSTVSAVYLRALVV